MATAAPAEHCAGIGGVASASEDCSGAADQAAELFEAPADPIGNEIAHPVFEHQEQFSPLAPEVSCRQYAGPRSRYQMRDTKRRAKKTRALNQGGG